VSRRRGRRRLELFAYAQRGIDDGSAESLPLLDSIRLESFRRKKDNRALR
jgi:hypothetical protein